MGVFCAADQRNKVYAAASSFWKLVKQLRQHLRIAERKRWIHCWKWRRKTIYLLFTCYFERIRVFLIYTNGRSICTHRWVICIQNWVRLYLQSDRHIHFSPFRSFPEASNFHKNTGRVCDEQRKGEAASGQLSESPTWRIIADKREVNCAGVNEGAHNFLQSIETFKTCFIC